jgi:hypothetical protein
MAGKFSTLINDIKTNPNLSKIGSVFQDLIDGNILVRKSIRRQYILVFLVASLCIIYIGNRYTCDTAMRRQRELVKEIEDRRFEFLGISAELTEESRGSVIEDSVSTVLPDLQVSRVPSIVIKPEK